ncbi:transporter [Paenarthrobacter sp. RAF9]
MVAHLLSLKWRLLLNGFKRSPWQLVGMALGLLYALGVLSLLVGGLVALRWADAGIAHTVVVLGGAVTVLGWAIIPLVASAADMTLDPARFTTFAIPPRQLLTGLALAGFIGIPGLATLIAALGTVGTWWRSVPAVSGALLGAVLGAVTCVVLSKVVTTATAGLASSRRFKDVSSIIVFIPLVLLGPIMAGVVDGVRGSAEYLPALARTVSWTPFGAPWSLGGDLAAGDVVAAAVKLLISVATIVVLLFSWHLLLQRALVTPPYSGGSAKKGGKLGLFGLLPGTPAGAVAARALIYWFKDPRYAASLVIVPMFPVLFFFAGSQSGSYGLLMILGPLTAFTMAWSICADVSYDNTAFALHLAAGVRGLDVAVGPLLGLLLFVLGVRLGGKWLDARGPEMFAQLSVNR